MGDQLCNTLQYSNFGGKPSEWIMATQTHASEFAKKVDDAENAARNQGDRTSNYLSGDNNGITCNLLWLKGRMFNDPSLHTSFTAKYEEIYRELTNNNGSHGPTTNSVLRTQHLLDFFLDYEQQYPTMIPPVKQPVPNALTIAELLGTVVPTTGTQSSAPMASTMPPAPMVSIMPGDCFFKGPEHPQN